MLGLGHTMRRDEAARDEKETRISNAGSGILQQEWVWVDRKKSGRRDSNPHEGYPSADFKSAASAISPRPGTYLDRPDTNFARPSLIFQPANATPNRSTTNRGLQRTGRPRAPGHASPALASQAPSSQRKTESKSLSIRPNIRTSVDHRHSVKKTGKCPGEDSNLHELALATTSK